MSEQYTIEEKGLLNGLGEILDPVHTAIIVVDMQNDFCAENGYIHTTLGADMSGNKPLAKRIGELVNAGRAAGCNIVWIKAIYDHELLPAPMLSKMLVKGKGAVCCESNSWGADFYEIGPQDGEQIVEKRCYSAFHNTQLDDILRRRGIKSLVMTGVATNVCVDSTLREAFFHGYYIVMPPDCVGSANLALHEATITSVDHIFGEVPEGATVMDIWAGKSEEVQAAE
jgi:ureidoacrylate peracid hydrolase